MGLPPRSLAAEANDCFMVRPPDTGPTEYKGAARVFARNGGLPSVRSTSPPFCDGVILRASVHCRRQAEPNLIERCAVLAAVKPASRRLGRWPAASLDRRSAQRTPMMQAGAKKRLFNRTKKLQQAKKELVPPKIS
jgi:hypothetical protein